MKNKINSLTLSLMLSVFLAGICLTDVWAINSDDEEQTSTPSQTPTACADLSAKDTVLWEENRGDMEMTLRYADMQKLSNDSCLKRFRWQNMTDSDSSSRIQQTKKPLRESPSQPSHLRIQ